MSDSPHVVRGGGERRRRSFGVSAASPIGNSGWEVRVRWPGDEEPRRVTLDVLRRAPVEWLQPVRRLKDYRGARGRLTFQPVSSLGRSFLVESRHEAIRLIELDFFRQLEWLVTQPLLCRVGKGPGYVPDFLYKVLGGGVVMENVRAPEKRDERFWRGSDVARDLAAQLGWGYSVAGETVKDYGAVLERLSAYARVEPRRDVLRAVAMAFERQADWRLGALVDECVGRDPYGVASVYALMWRRVLRFPLEAGLSSRTVVTLGGSDAL